MDCSPRLYDFFEKLGFKEYLGIKYSEEYGEVKIMKFNVNNYFDGLLSNDKLKNKYNHGKKRKKVSYFKRGKDDCHPRKSFYFFKNGKGKIKSSLKIKRDGNT